MQRYLAAVYFGGLPAETDGPLCAIDIDGVLESSPLGFSAMTNASAIALRSLKAHGYRAVLVTGRSLDEVIDRCEAYQLTGAVAEYGSVFYDRDADEAFPLLSPSEIAAVEQLRACLRERRNVDVDAGYRNIARVRHSNRDGFVPLTELEGLPEPAFGSWQYIVGDGQTDIVAPGIDKGRGLRALAARVQRPDRCGPADIALAVGDTEADLPMLRLAERAYAPANATSGLRASSVPVVRGAYQRGLSEAVGQLIGHPPGQCPICRPPIMGAGRTELLQLLSTQEAGQRGMPGRVARLAAGLLTKEARR
jgi:hydroxymethylpyrimidine pyrophosphatase-like HAD family hydrolase